MHFLKKRLWQEQFAAAIRENSAAALKRTGKSEAMVRLTDGRGFVLCHADSVAGDQNACHLARR